MTIRDFNTRHVGPREDDVQKMCSAIGVDSIEQLISQTIPQNIRNDQHFIKDEGISEQEYLRKIETIAEKNKLFKNYIGLGYYGTVLPPVIQRNILENPGWYTSYTPYQAEISQGRLEALLNFQTVVMELTGMELANASLLDEATAAAEAMIMFYNLRSRQAAKQGVNKFFIDCDTFPQTIDVLQTRCEAIGIELIIDDYQNVHLDGSYFGALVQYPAASGKVNDYKAFTENAHAHDVKVAFACDIMSLVLLTPPGQWDADAVLGSTQRFGVPIGYGGPHAAYFATREKFKRNIPGRIIGVSIDRHGNNALRMALQTREQHIKREKATSNICTAQALLATMAGMYAVYHGPDGLKEIAWRIHKLTVALDEKLSVLGLEQLNPDYFDTLHLRIPSGIKMTEVKKIAEERQVNFFYEDEQHIRISLDESTLPEDVNEILDIFIIALNKKRVVIDELPAAARISLDLQRNDSYMQQVVFKCYHSETEMMRYIKRLEQKDFSLVHSMIPLGSCTMKLNAAVEMMPITWPLFGNMHPFAPLDQVEGYHELIHELGKDLEKITGFGAVSFQPNSGASGEYTGLMVIRAYHRKNNQAHRTVTLIPASAHGTNPASAVSAGMDVVIVDCDEHGNICIENLKKHAEENKDRLAAFMVTYPSTHGVFEDDIMEMTKIIHDNGGLVYMDGANLNAQLGLTNPAVIGADVCHLNLHKTFAIPHGGGGPGMGPIAVADHLVEFLPTHPLFETGGANGINAIAAAPYGSAGILPISYAYIKLVGGEGLRLSAQIAILNANYIASNLRDYFNVLYSNKNDRVAHELILDCRPFKSKTGISEIDVAKRLIDYGFHAPTVSFPVPGTLMVEPTESESKEELDRFIEAMISIFYEIKAVEETAVDPKDNVLVNAPHTIEEMTADEWTHQYKRENAAYPLEWLKEKKFWPAVARVNDAHGDRNLICSCMPIDAYRKEVLCSG